MWVMVYDSFVDGTEMDLRFWAVKGQFNIGLSMHRNGVANELFLVVI